jgi:hypothetical protein
MRWFHAAAQKLAPVASGSLSLRKSKCIRKNCSVCASGEGHSSHVLYGRRDGKRFSTYFPEEVVRQVREAITNGRLIQELVTEAGVRFTEALKAKCGKASVQ